MAKSPRKPARKPAGKKPETHSSPEGRKPPESGSPRLVNLENDTIELMMDHFTFEPGHRDKVIQALASAPGVELLDAGALPAVLLFKHPTELSADTLVGRMEVDSSDLRLQTNSRRRADELRDLIRNSCHELVLHRGRSGT